MLVVSSAFIQNFDHLIKYLDLTRAFSISKIFDIFEYALDQLSYHWTEVLRHLPTLVGK